MNKLPQRIQRVACHIGRFVSHWLKRAGRKYDSLFIWFFEQLWKVKRWRRIIRPVFKTVYPQRRLLALTGAIAVLAGIIMPVLTDGVKAESYSLSKTAASIVTPTNDHLMKQVTYEATKQEYTFNKEGIPTDSSLPAPLQKNSLGTPTNKDAATFSATLPTDLAKGVKYYDTNTQLDFTMTPQFSSSAGQASGGRLVYPMPGNMQAVYTVKANGIKEDIIVEHTTEQTLTFAYTLQLPKTLESKLRPDGSIGIYSADPTLFGNITYGDDSDKARVEAARENGEKTNLTFVIPTPVILGPDGNRVGGPTVNYELEGNTLKVVAKGLDQVDHPVSIDPSVVITTTADFQNRGNNEGMIDYSVSGQITRSGLTGGSVGAWSTLTGTPLPGGRYEHAMTVYNGFMYVVTGNSGSSYPPHTLIASINSNGTIGTFTQSPNNYNNARVGMGLVAYNGYLYIGGGYVAGAVADTQYAPINADGTIGAWTASTSFTTGRYAPGMAAYNNYMYIFGGDSGGNTAVNTVQYAPIKGDGSLGTWAATTAFTTARFGMGVAVYNGVAYIYGGTNGTNDYSDVQYSPVASNGTLGTWTATSSFTTARGFMIGGQYNGYLYAMTGITGGAYRNDVQYAPIEADGTLGTWATTNSIITARSKAAGTFYNGYAYVSGGTNGTAQADVQYAKIDAPGSVIPYTATGAALPAARSQMCSAAYGGYIYALGGSTSNNGANNVTTTYYATLSTAGVVGTWTATTALPEARSAMGCFIYNGYIYAVGGYTGTSVASNLVRHAPINTAAPIGGIGTWVTSDNALNQATISPGLFVYTANNTPRLYAPGGSVAAAQYTTIGANGVPGSWTAGAALPNTYTNRAYAQTGNIIYAIGGLNGTAAVTNVYYTVIDTSTGVPAAWTTAAGSLTTAQASAGGGVGLNGCIYIVGGQSTSTAATNLTQYVCPATNGSIAAGTWQTSSNNLTVTTMNLALTAYNGYLFGIGGYNGAAAVTTTQFGRINNGGLGMLGANGTTTNAMKTASNATDSPRYFHSTVAYNGFLYVLGGVNGTTYNNSVIYAPFNGNGTVGAWADAPSFTTARAYLSVAIYNGRLYLTGGYNGTTFYDDYQVATVLTSGNLRWETGSGFVGSTGSARATHGSIAYNGYLYIEGGLSTTTTYLDSVKYAPINANGSLGAWATNTNSLPDQRATSVAVAYNGYLYVLGGRLTGPVYINTVVYAPINADGTIGVFRYTQSFKNTRNYLGTAIANGYLYIFGGWDGTNYYNDVQYAVINGNGTFGPWQYAGTMTSARYGVSAVYYDGFVYITGGTTGTGQSTVDYAPIQSIQRIGRYTKLLDFGNAVGAVTGFTLNGLIPGQNGALSYRTAPSDGVFGTVNYLSTDTSSQTCSTVSRYILLVLVLDDSGDKSGGAGAFPDASSTDAYSTDITVSTQFGHPPAPIRLRHGQTMQLGSLSPLDTCYP